MEEIIVIDDFIPGGEVVVDEEIIEHVVAVEESGPRGGPGPEGKPGPPGPPGQGVLVLNMGDPVPPDTPDNTVIFRKEPG